jgi:3',5'-cyclic AMP phosphodiesterase CpdA
MNSLTLAQLSDIHISCLGDHHEMLSGRSAGFLADIVADLNRQPDLDFVLFSGDLLDTAAQSEFDQWQQAIRLLRRPYYIIPGNHDRREPESEAGFTRRQVARLFNPQINARPAAPAAQAGYWSLPLNPAVQLIGLDTIRDEDWGGVIEAAQITWLESELTTHADKFVILMVHHPLHKLAPIDDHPDYHLFVCDNGPKILALLDQYPQVKVVLTGHHHHTKADWLGRRLHLACPAIVGYPCAYRLLRLTHLADGGWRFEWQTQPATNPSTIAEARRRMLDTWVGVGFSAEVVEQHIILALGSEWDRQGVAEWPG